MISPFIDAHVHLNTISPEKMDMAIKYGASFLSINTDIPFFNSLDDQRETAVELSDKYPGKVKFITSFSVANWQDRGWSDQAIAQIKTGLDAGAVGVKIWKNIGMELRDLQGNFIMLDHKSFDPVFDFLEEHDILVLGHLGEPRNCWLPLDEMTVDSDRDYFSQHPEYHMHLHPEYPSYAQQLTARDERLKKHPKLRFVGLHLASLEWSIAKVGNWLDSFPLAMTDLAERICHLQYQTHSDREGVRDFIIKYQDRIIYGTDVIDDGAKPGSEVASRLEALWDFHWRFFSGDQDMTAPEFTGSFQGLDLHKDVLVKIFYSNAAKLYSFL